MTNFEKYTKRVSKIITSLESDSITVAGEACERGFEMLRTLRRSHLAYAERRELTDRLNVAMRVWTYRKQTEERPKLIEGGALVARKSQALLRVVS